MTAKAKIFAILWGLGLTSLNAQSVLTLEECYQAARENYPLIKKLELIEKTENLNLSNANKAYLPQLSFSGQATYQSETIDFSSVLGSGLLPSSIALPSVSKDQYRVVGEVSQLLYNGGATKSQKELVKANSELQKQSVENQLYSLKQRINTLFFSALLTKEQLKQNQIIKETLLSQIKKTETALKNGTALPSQVEELKAEIINIDMKSTEIEANQKAVLKMLSVFVGKEISSEEILQKPEYEMVTLTNNRPELKWYDLQSAVYDLQEKQLRSDYLPKVSLFVQGAYGRPTLNIIRNEFDVWYVAGVRFNWSLGSLYSLSNKKKILNYSKLANESDRETFLMNVAIDQSQQEKDVQKYNQLIEQDKEVIALRKSVAKYAETQLDNGVITTHEYLQKINAENLAQQTLILHEIQLLQAKEQQKIVSGN